MYFLLKIFSTISQRFFFDVVAIVFYNTSFFGIYALHNCCKVSRLNYCRISIFNKFVLFVLVHI